MSDQEHRGTNERAYLTYTANDRKYGATLEELTDFVEACRRVGVDPSARVEVTSTWKRTIRQLRVDGALKANGGEGL